MHILHRLKIRHVKFLLEIILNGTNSSFYTSIVGPSVVLILEFSGSLTSVVLCCRNFRYAVGVNVPSMFLFYFVGDLIGGDQSYGYFGSFAYSACFNLLIISGLLYFTCFIRIFSSVTSSLIFIPNRIIFPKATC